MIPLVVGRGTVFGALQLEAASDLDRDDVAFVNALANQLAIALDRDRTRRHDVVRRREAQLSQARYENVVDHLDAAFVWEADLESHRISYVSAQFEPLLGFSRRECLRADGSRFQASYAAAAVRRDGCVIGAVLEFHDITGRGAAAPPAEPSGPHPWLAELDRVQRGGQPTQAVAVEHDRAPGLVVPDPRDECVEVFEEVVDLVDLDAHTRRPAVAARVERPHRVAGVDQARPGGIRMAPRMRIRAARGHCRSHGSMGRSGRTRTAIGVGRRRASCYR